jgi:hypothetical protein
MDGIEPLVIREYLIGERQAAINRVHDLSRALGIDDPCLNREQTRALCRYFGVDSLAAVLALVDVKEAM